MNVRAILFKHRARKDGTMPVYIRITVKKKCSYISTGVFIRPNHWDCVQGKAKTNFTAYAELNDLVRKKIEKIEKADIKLKDNDDNHLAVDVKIEAGKKDMSDIFEFASDYIQRYNNKQTYGKYVTTLTKLLAYMKRNGHSSRKMSFQKITVPFLEGFEGYLAKTLNNDTNTIYQNMKTIRSLFNGAIDRNIITADIYPFRTFKLKTKETYKQSLSKSEMKLLSKVKLLPGSMEYHARSAFFLQFYLAGLRVGDVISLRWDDMNDDYSLIQRRSRKTGKPIHLRVPEAARRIIGMYKNQGEFVLPYVKNKNRLDQEIWTGTSMINSALKSIAIKAGVNSKITTHIARHTWSRLAIESGVNVFEIQQILGHSSIKTTQGYLGQINISERSTTNEKVITGIKLNMNN